MTILLILFLVVLILILFYFTITPDKNSQFGVIGNTSPVIQDSAGNNTYKVEIYFNYRNPANFGNSTARFKCIILYLERVVDLGANIL